MFKRLLVPLDGSKLAESALPVVSFLTQVFETSVVLVHVIEQNPPEKVHGEHHLRTAEEAKKYLEEISCRSLPPDALVEYHVHTTEVQKVAKSIIDHVREFDSDLIVMCTHGGGGAHDLLFGSIAQQVMAFGATPVLVIRPSLGTVAASFRCKRILVPLDGNPEHERCLPLAVDLAIACESSLHLLTVVPTFGTLSGEWTVTSRLLPGTTSRMLDMSVSGLEEYLQSHQSRLQRSGLEVTCDVLRGEPSQIIVDAGQALEIDVIVLGTHGKKGTGAFWAGSVASKVSRNSRTPLLLVPVKK